MQHRIACVTAALLVAHLSAQEPVPTTFAEPIHVGLELPGYVAPIHGAFHADDMDGDGDRDLLIATTKLLCVWNTGSDARPVFGEAIPLLAGGQPIEIEAT